MIDMLNWLQVHSSAFMINDFLRNPHFSISCMYIQKVPRVSNLFFRSKRNLRIFFFQKLFKCQVTAYLKSDPLPDDCLLITQLLPGPTTLESRKNGAPWKFVKTNKHTYSPIDALWLIKTSTKISIYSGVRNRAIAPGKNPKINKRRSTCHLFRTLEYLMTYTG